MNVRIPMLLLSLASLMAACSPNVVESMPTAVPLTDRPQLEVMTPTPRPSPTSLPAQPATTAAPEESIETAVLPISLFIIVDEGEAYSSARDADELRQILADVNGIWSQTHVELEVRAIETIMLPAEVAADIAAGNFDSFFVRLQQDIVIPNPALINGFYASDIGGPNGIVPYNSRLFFVADEPSVLDERVTAHEIGHILGLHHVLDDRESLMFSGTNGMNLSPEEAIVAQYAAQGILNRVR